MAQIKLCPNCERRNLSVNAVCDFCGTALEHAPTLDAPDLAPPRISINNQMLSLPLQVELVIGRTDPSSNWTPEIDLTPFGGTSAAGVSRRHARLMWFGHWQIQDLQSANGTLLNSQRLDPETPQDLKPGAIIQIGKLYLVFHG